MAKTKGYDIVGVGLCICDMIMVISESPAFDKLVFGSDFQKHGGGPTATGLVASARLGAKNSFIGFTGKEDEGRFIIREFKKEGINVDNLRQYNDGTSITIVLVDKASGSRGFCVKFADSSCFKIEPEDEKVISKAKYLHTEGFLAQQSLDSVNIAKKYGVKVMLDAGYVTPGIDKIVPLSDILITSEGFAKEFTKKEMPEDSLRYLKDMGPEVVGITLGEKGSIFLADSEIISHPCYKVDVKDTTGAGDVFHGAFLVGLLQGWDIKKVIDFSTAVSAIKCTEVGGRKGIPTMEKTLEFLKKNSSMKW